MADRSDDQKIGLAIKLVGLGVGVYALKKVGEFLGVFKTAEEEKVDTSTASASESAEEIQSGNPYIAFNPNYAVAIVQAYNKKFKPKVFNGNYQMRVSPLQYKMYADQLYNAKGGIFNDNEDSVYDIFRSITTQWQLSLLASTFHAFYKKDLLEYLKGFLDANELSTLLQIISNYPHYRK